MQLLAASSDTWALSVVGVALAGIASLLLSLTASTYLALRRNRLEKERAETRRAARESYARAYRIDFGDTTDIDLVAAFEEALKESPATEIAARADPSREVSEALRKRIEAIEERLPDARTVDKVASINDAILATKIEALEKQVESLQSQALSRWDIALTVFAILAAIGGVIGIAGALVKLF